MNCITAAPKKIGFKEKRKTKPTDDFCTSTLTWTDSQIVRYMVNEVQQRCTIKNVSMERGAQKYICRFICRDTLLFYSPINPFSTNQIGGTNNAGSIFSVLQSFSPRIPIPELAMRMPPMIEISVISSGERNGARNPAHT